MSIAEAEAVANTNADAEPNGQGMNYTNEDKDYGITWMYLPDGSGIPQIAYLTEEAEGSRGRRKNVKDAVRFELYTK